MLVGSSIGLVACEEEQFSKPMTLGGKQVSAETLNAGKEEYTHYCRACHGDKGDGKVPPPSACARRRATSRRANSNSPPSRAARFRTTTTSAAS